MPFSIPLTGLAANDPVPGNYLEINFAQGAASLGTATYPVLLMGNKLAAGDGVLDTVVYGPGANSPLPLSSLQDFINRFGQGSELHRMARRFLSVNTITPVYAIAVTQSVGAAATLPITFATNATANGNARIFVGDEFVDVAITNADTVTTIAANAVLAINSKFDWAVTATSSVGVLTITSKQLGLRGNWLRGSAVITGVGVGTTSSVTAQTFFTGGTTADSNVTALSTILPSRYYYIVSAAEDVTQLPAVASQVNTQSLPITGIRQRVVGASVDVNANAITISTALNNARAELIWMEKAEWTPAELAAYMAAIYSMEEAPLQFRVNFSGYGNDPISSVNWKVPPSKTTTAAPTRATIKASLNAGLTPIQTTAQGTTSLVKRITTRFYQGSVATLDYRIRDAHKVTVCDRFGDDWLSVCALQFSGKKLANDPAKGQRPTSNDVVSPRILLATLQKLEDQYNDLGLLQNIDTIKANSYAIREASPLTRASVKVPLQTVDILDQIATSLDQVA